MRRLLPVLIALLVAGCTAVVDGRGVRAGGTSPLPPRPFEIRLDDIDPCTLLTAAQRAELGFGSNRSISGTANSTFYGGEIADCLVRTYDEQAVVTSATRVTTAGVEVFFGPNVVSEVLVIDVRGFPAVLAEPTDPKFCTVALDVADGQLVDVYYADGGGIPPVPQPRLCDGARAVAGAVMDTLLAG